MSNKKTSIPSCAFTIQIEGITEGKADRGIVPESYVTIVDWNAYFDADRSPPSYDGGDMHDFFNNTELSAHASFKQYSVQDLFQTSIPGREIVAGEVAKMLVDRYPGGVPWTLLNGLIRLAKEDASHEASKAEVAATRWAHDDSDTEHVRRLLSYLLRSRRVQDLLEYDELKGLL